MGLLITDLIVKGQPADGPGTNSRERIMPISSRPSTSQVLSRSPSSRRQATGDSFNIKIIQAKMKKMGSSRPEFTVLSQHYISINEITANVTYILAAVRERWGSSYVIVTGDGLRVEDSSGTQGYPNTFIQD